MIQVKVWTLSFNSQIGIFDDEEFNNFVKDKELVLFVKWLLPALEKFPKNRVLL